MNLGTIILIVVLIVVLVLIFYVIGTYNSLVSIRNRLKDSWAQIEVLLKRRADLIPNLVETVKGYASHEKETLNAVVEARTKAISAKTKDEEIKSNSELSNALGRLLAISESYPDLKANENFLHLQTQLQDTEDKISYSRQAYNDAVLIYKNKIEMSPSNVIASIFNFKPEQFFLAEEKDKEVPKVQF